MNKINSAVAETLADSRVGVQVTADGVTYEVHAIENNVETTRWGYRNRVILHVGDELYAFTYEVGSGDAEYSTFEDYDELNLERVEAVSVTSTVYRPI